MNNNNFLLRNIVVKNLSSLGLILHWDTEEPEEDSWLQLTWGLGRLELENVIDGLNKLKQLHHNINQEVCFLKSKKISFEWNYLGTTFDREEYLKILNTFFWQNQNEEEVIGHPDYIAWLEEPWKILNSSDNLKLEIPTATNNFSTNSVNFFDTLEKSLNEASFQPYLIISAEASFQWSFNLDGERVVSGVIMPATNMAYLEIYI
jgi:hypothetical protein